MLKRSFFLTDLILEGYRKLTLRFFPIGQKVISRSSEARPVMIASKAKEEFTGFQILLSSTPPFLNGRLPRLGKELEQESRVAMYQS
jgi:hypothetical protein